MHDDELRSQIQQAVDHHARHLSPDPFLAQRIMRQERTERKMFRLRKLPVGLIIALILLLLTATALAVALLSPREVVEKVAVPMAKSSRQENYTYEELSSLIGTLNENGITLDEGSRLMQAFQTGHGYWEQDTIEEICRSAFGKREGAWSIEQKHWYGEMMVSIGAWDENVYVLPDETDMTAGEARELACEMLKKEYGADLPFESNGQWEIQETFESVYVYNERGEESQRIQWAFWFLNQHTGNVDYEVTFDRSGSQLDIWRAAYLEEINTKNWATVMDDLENRDGMCSAWGVETWAEFGRLIQSSDPGSRNGWLYQHAGYRLPPDGAVSPAKAMEIARNAMNYGQITGRLEEHILCCTDGNRPIYKVNHRVIFKAEDADRGGKYDAVWCLEIDCMTGEVLEKRAFSYGPEGDHMMMYVPFSLLKNAPATEEIKPGSSQAEQRVMELARKEEEAMRAYGENMYFWPMEIKQAVYGDSYTPPTQEEYARALQIATDAIADKYGASALGNLGDYRVGQLHHRYDDEKENGCLLLVWDFMFTTDPIYLSDGYRVQFEQYVYAKDGLETIRELIVEHANMGNG